MRAFIFQFSIILLSAMVIFSPYCHATELNEANSADLIALAETTLSTDFTTFNSDGLSEITRAEIEFMDAVLENKIEKLIVLLESDALRSSQFLQYFTTYYNLSNSENHENNASYKLLLSGTENDDWRVQHLCSIMLAIFNSLNHDVVEGLNFAENALSIIPNNENFIENNARFDATYVLYLLFAVDSDIVGMTRTLERLLDLANQTGRGFNKFSTLNNLAVVVERNGNGGLATKITNLLVTNLDNALGYDVFIANLSHGRFLLKDNKSHESVQYLMRAVELAPNVEYEAYLWVDLANAQANSGDFKAAQVSLENYNKIAKAASSVAQYAERHIGETRALIAAGDENYKQALIEYKAFMNEQIAYYKAGLSADRRTANRRVLLSQELAEKELEKAELQLALDQSRLARQRVLNRIYLGLILLGGLITIAAILVVRKMGNLNEKLRVANALVIEKSKVKSDLLAMFSHEMLTPLNGIVPLADALQQSEGDGKKRNLLKMIEQNGSELTRKIKDIIMISNPDDQSNNPRSLDVQRFLQQTGAEHSIDLADDIAFNVHMGRSVPQNLYLDKTRLQTIVTALLSNAFKYTVQGEVRLSIYMKEDDDGVAVMEISDTGKGMPRDNVGNMLKSFEQASLSINRDNQGLGLGLSIVRLQCRVMEAELDVQSEEGVGTVVKISFPKTALYGELGTEADLYVKQVA